MQTAWREARMEKFWATTYTVIAFLFAIITTVYAALPPPAPAKILRAEITAIEFDHKSNLVAYYRSKKSGDGQFQPPLSQPLAVGDEIELGLSESGKAYPYGSVEPVRAAWLLAAIGWVVTLASLYCQVRSTETRMLHPQFRQLALGLFFCVPAGLSFLIEPTQELPNLLPSPMAASSRQEEVQSIQIRPPGVVTIDLGTPGKATRLRVFGSPRDLSVGTKVTVEEGFNGTPRLAHPNPWWAVILLGGIGWAMITMLAITALAGIVFGALVLIARIQDRIIVNRMNRL
ncbi:MAG: hypothetical protein ACOYON_06985 [Fimbriimonas sp.]